MWNIQRYLCYVMGIILVVYGSHRIYLISFITVLILCSLSVCQFISHFAIEEDNTEEGNRDEGGNHHSDPASYQPSSSLRTQRSASNSSLEQHINGTNVKEDLETSSSSTASSSTTDEEEDERKWLEVIECIRSFIHKPKKGGFWIQDPERGSLKSSLKNC